MVWVNEVLTPPWLLDTMPSQDGSQPHDNRVVDAVEALTPRQREVIEGLFFERASQSALARRWGISRQSVSVTRRRALANLRRALE